MLSLLQKRPMLIVVTVLSIFFLASLSVSSQESTTMDEQAHIPSAYSYVRYGDMRLNPEHPPLLKDLAGLPLLLVRPHFPVDDPAWMTGVNEQWQLGNKFLHQYGNDAGTITYWSRFPIVIIAVLLGILIYVWARELAGTLAGLFALVLYAADPNILAHGHYVTTDLGIAAAIAAATYFFVRFLKQPTGKRLVLAGIFLGVAQLTKFSGVLLFPLFGLLAVIYALARGHRDIGPDGRPKTFGFLVEYVWKYAVIVVICFATIWTLYVPNTMNMPGEKIRDVACYVFVKDEFRANDIHCSGFSPEYAKNIGAQVAFQTVDAMSRNAFLKPLGEYFLGVFMVFVRVAGGNTYYFLGTVSNHATPWYFPTVFILKETLPLLILILATGGYSLIRSFRSFGRTGLPIGERAATFVEGHITQISMGSFIFLYAYLSVTGNLNIGFRHLFPILPFIFILVAKVTTDFFRRLKTGDERKTFRTVATGLFSAIVFWVLAIPVVNYPFYLSYFNESVGGHRNGYLYVTDSNYDWGQDLKNLKKWVDRYNACVGAGGGIPPHDCDRLTERGTLPTTEPIDRIRIDYFGGSNPEYYFGDMFIPWHGESSPQAGWYAVSAGFYQESRNKTVRPDEWSYRWLEKYPLVGRAGDSIFIFYVPNPPLQR